MTPYPILTTQFNVTLEDGEIDISNQLIIFSETLIFNFINHLLIMPETHL